MPAKNSPKTREDAAPAKPASKKVGAETVKAKAKAKSAKPAAKFAGTLPKKPPKPVDAATRHEIFRRLAAANPDPRSDLEYTNPFTLLVAVVLSAQATDAGVNKATRRLFAVADTPAAMLALGEEGVKEHIKTIGLFNAKAKNVVALSRILVEEHGGAVPPSRAVLENLPGVGKKTAAVVVNVAFGEATIAVDTHIFRVSHRIPLAYGRTTDAIEAALTPIVPEEFRRNAHHWLILHGRYVCKARKPECWRCVIADLCRFADKTPEPKPAKGKAAAQPTIEPDEESLP
ncbi:endonuclease III [Salinarimonas sp.]|uniref:endonuclease III n=1 Tax=Salinarimonas sp. TaxID=2766526 RepID=UPI0035B50273